MKNTINRNFKVVLRNLKSIRKENLNELNPVDLVKIQECITLIEQGVLEKGNCIRWDAIVFQVLELLNRVVKSLPAMSALLKKLGE